MEDIQATVKQVESLVVIDEHTATTEMLCHQLDCG
ncbi:MAG: hypothetical protein ACD_45C00221G0002 [uncultured bacterium]|nr:MAG: hypothetical protein ACD_45C00221G0002 [uncultured bacterium]